MIFLKTIIRSSHPPLEPILISTKKDEVTKEEVKASPFNIADDQTPIVSLIEQNNFTNQSLHIIGQQLDCIEEKIVKKPVSEKIVSVKTEKPLIDLPSQREKVMFRTSQSKTLEIVKKMLSDLKVKTEGTSTSAPAARTISKKEIVFEKNTDSDTVSFVLLLLQKGSLMMISQKLKDLLETPSPCLLLKTGIQNSLLLICSLKKDLFKHNFLFLLISFMNGILMLCLNKKSLIK